MVFRFKRTVAFRIMVSSIAIIGFLASTGCKQAAQTSDIMGQQPGSGTQNNDVLNKYYPMARPLVMEDVCPMKDAVVNYFKQRNSTMGGVDASKLSRIATALKNVRTPSSWTTNVSPSDYNDCWLNMYDAIADFFAKETDERAALELWNGIMSYTRQVASPTYSKTMVGRNAIDFFDAVKSNARVPAVKKEAASESQYFARIYFGK